MRKGCYPFFCVEIKKVIKCSLNNEVMMYLCKKMD